MKKTNHKTKRDFGLFFECMIFALIIGIVWGVTGGVAYAASFELNGYLKNKTALRLHSPDDLMKMENTCQIQLDKRFTNNISSRIILRYFYDAVFDIENDGIGAVPNVRNNLQDTFNLSYQDLVREAYVDITQKKWFLRLGKQQVVWGKTDGFRLLDVVNPIDYRDFTVPEWEDKILPLWMIRAEYSPTYSTTMQFLFIPYYQLSPLAPPFTPWSFRAVDNFQQGMDNLGVPISPNSYDEAKNPAHTLSNSVFGFRWYQQIGQLGYSLNYMYKWTNIVHSKPQFTPIFKYDMTPDRINLFGGSFDYAFDSLMGMRNVVLRGEAAYIRDDTIYGSLRPDMTVAYDKNRFDYILGFDKYFFVDYWVSIQFYQKIICDWKKSDGLTDVAAGFVDPVENAWTIFIMKDYFQEKINVEALLYYSDDNDWWLRPRVKWEAIGSKLWVTLGANFFWGHSNNFAGEFKKNDQLILELKYCFSK